MGWTPAVPDTMPAYNLGFTAQFHKHLFTEAERKGDCKTGIHLISRCTCGQERDEIIIAPHTAHTYAAVVSDNGNRGNTVDKIVCTTCGDTKEQNIQFKVSYSQLFWTTVLDLSLLENEVVTDGPQGENIEMRFYVGDSNRSYTGAADKVHSLEIPLIFSNYITPK